MIKYNDDGTITRDDETIGRWKPSVWKPGDFYIQPTQSTCSKEQIVINALAASLKNCLRFVNHLAFKDVVKEANDALKLSGDNNG